MAALRLKNLNRGFTLVEMIVAVGVFALIAVLTVGALLILTAAEKRVFNIQTNQDNLRFALETMAREIRTGTDYRQDPPYNTNKDGFQFVNALGQNIVYELGTTNAHCGGIPLGPGQNCIAKSFDGGSTWQPVTAPEVKLEKLVFYLPSLGPLPLDGVQPRVTIGIQAVTPGTSPNASRLNVETTVSQLLKDS